MHRNVQNGQREVGPPSVWTASPAHGSEPLAGQTGSQTLMSLQHRLRTLEMACFSRASCTCSASATSISNLHAHMHTTRQCLLLNLQFDALFDAHPAERTDKQRRQQHTHMVQVLSLTPYRTAWQSPWKARLARWPQMSALFRQHRSKVTSLLSRFQRASGWAS